MTDQNKVGVWIANNPASGKKWSSLYADGTRPVPQLLLSEDFESGTDGIFSPNGTLTSAAVTSNPHSGTYSLRFNLQGSNAAVDPLTGLPRSGQNTQKINIKTLYPASRSLSEHYFEWWVRFDDAELKGFNQDTQQEEPATPKLCYLSDLTDVGETGCAPFIVIQEGSGIRSLARNLYAEATFDPLPVVGGGSAMLGACTGCGFAYNGQWNKFGIRHDKVNNTLEMWCNDVKWIDNRGYNGVIPISPLFATDCIRFFHAGNSVTDRSVDRTGIAAGVQVDGFKFYDRKPVV